MATKTKMLDMNIRLLGIRDLSPLVRLQMDVHAALQNPDLLHVFDPRFYLEHISGGRGRTIGVEADGKLVACVIVAFPGGDEDNLGRDIGLDPGEHPKVAQIEGLCIAPEYRGLGLDKMIERSAYEVILRRKAHHVLATVSPMNYPSLAMLLRTEFRVKALRKKYTCS